MKKNYLVFSLFLITTFIYGQNQLRVIADDGFIYGISEDGKYVAGQKFGFPDGGPFKWSVEEGMSIFFEGSSVDVSNNGIIVGQFEDPNYTYLDWEGNPQPILSAGYYKDNTWYSLGVNPDILHLTADAGSTVKAINGDGTIMAGSMKSANESGDFVDRMTPTVWTNGVATKLDFINKGQGAQVNSISSDGTVLAGWYDPSFGRQPALWVNGVFKLITYNGLNIEGEALYVSPNGKYVALSLGKNAALYDVENEKLTIIEKKAGARSAEAFAVSDNGIIVGYNQIGDGFERDAFIYTHELGMMGLEEYAMKAGITIPVGFYFKVPVAISADGTRITGHGIGLWVLDITQPVEVLNRPQNAEVTETNIGDVSVIWNAPESSIGSTLLGYNVYRNGVKINTSVITENTYSESGLNSNEYFYTVSAVWSTGESSPSQPVRIETSKLLSTPFYEDFSSMNIYTNGWKTDYIRSWEIDAESGLNEPCIVFVTPSNASYDYSLTSSYFDTSNTNKLNISYNLLSFIEGNTTEEPNQKLSLEYYDGTSWVEINQHSGITSSGFAYNKYEITGLNIDKIQIRFRVWGVSENNPIQWFIDNVRLYTDENAFTEDAPIDLKANENADYSVSLTWLDPTGNATGSLSYTTTLDYDPALGLSGNDFIIAQKFEPTDLANYDGFVISEVSVGVYSNPFFFPDDVIKYKVVLFEDNVKVYEQEVLQLNFPNDWNPIVLTTPYSIDVTKTLHIGVESSGYSDGNTTVALTTDASTYEKSTLISLDGGATWSDIQDLTEDNYYYKSSAISAKVQKTSSESPKEGILTYRIYRNGALIDRSLYTSYTDVNPAEGANCYQVAAFYDTQKESEKSNEVCLDIYVGIENNTLDSEYFIYPNPTVDYININGEFNSASVIDMAGKVVVKSVESQIDIRSLAKGIYLLQIDTPTGIVTKKIMKQ